MTTGHGSSVGSETAGRQRSIVKLQLDERSMLRRRPEVEHEREVAIFDLLEENFFVLRGDPVHEGPFHVYLKLVDDRLVMDVCDTGDAKIREINLPLKPFRMVIKDYFIVCESYFDAIKSSSPSQIEAIDMGRRALHNEGADTLRERIGADAEVDGATARRFFTLLCVLQMRG